MTRFNALTLREKFLLLALLPIALIGAGYQFAWVPLNAQRTHYTEQIAAYRLVTQTANLAKQNVNQNTVPPAPVNDTPLATRITQSSEASGIVLRRIETDGNGVRVTLADTTFTQLTLWLADLEQSSGVVVAAIEIDRRPEPGTVSTRILLEDL